MKQLLSCFALLALLAGLIFPVPAALVDHLLVINITLALLLLSSSLYVSEPLKISSLPSFLLLATIFRLTLNVSTTRLLLSTGDCGRVVEAFGRLVAQDNLIIGFVIFLIIVFIQLIVIAKGSERVAEVSARFTLDALPGKQMAIDADMRSGLINFSEARYKRKELQLESRFYSALDGAIKFIKGDAIAGLIITGINIIGGMLTAILIHGLSIKSAAAHYTLLTIGDGLVSQIPALLNSVAAGIIITRVSDSESANLGLDLINQLFSQKIVKISIALVCLLLSLFPGLPTVPFLLVGVGLLLLGEKSEKTAENNVFKFKSNAPAVIKILIPKAVMAVVSAQSLKEEIEKFKDQAYREFGMLPADPDIDIYDGNTLKIFLRGVEVLSSNYNPDNNLKELTKSLIQILKSAALEFLDDIHTRRLLDNLEKAAPELVASVVPEIATVTKITSLLRDLVAEDLYPRNFDLIIQSISESALINANYRQILENIRVRLKRQISEKYSLQGELKVITLDPDIDLSFYRADKTGAEFDLNYLELLTEAIRNRHDSMIPLLVSKGSRKLIKECLESKKINVVVLAYEEIVDSIKIISEQFIRSAVPISDKHIFQSRIN